MEILFKDNHGWIYYIENDILKEDICDCINSMSLFNIENVKPLNYKIIGSEYLIYYSYNDYYIVKIGERFTVQKIDSFRIIFLK